MGNSEKLLSLIAMGKVLGDRALERGVAVSAALARRGGKFVGHFKVTSYDNRFDCIPDRPEEVIDTQGEEIR